LAGGSHGLFEDTILAFVWIEQTMPQENLYQDSWQSRQYMDWVPQAYNITAKPAFLILPILRPTSESVFVLS